MGLFRAMFLKENDMEIERIGLERSKRSGKGSGERVSSESYRDRRKDGKTEK